MLETPLAIAKAKIRHRRFTPKVHQFEATLSYLYFDPDQITTKLSHSWLCSTAHWNILKVDENDFLKGYTGNLRQRIKKILLQQVDVVLPIQSEIRVLALPRMLGFSFNSVVFYFIFNSQRQLIFILTEITNTPWKERKVYVHDCRDQLEHHSEYHGAEFEFQKSFHVSPFMPMDIQYKWRFNFSDTQNVIHMQLHQAQKLIFDATMLFELENITVPSQLNRYAVHYVFEPFKMLASIYLQAFYLWRKKVPFYRHPKKDKDLKQDDKNAYFR
ncbi:hypothetical protein F909_02510 [Acinetobacter sp. ANC 3929]|uniref:DUF1365 domain-containing protein n=1 Tax=unclassified Acinetobacter TaxID=196816 RepID=UPI0002CF1BC9|nr:MULTISPECIES: DUF1365 domain-containing protein [unclassified Acinetobacter]ENW81219.1 hypothetical protein F909_02510 [Acinetobacter sp. ANC 3929]MCH7352303.1 DUF1365 domain-containing protein [Acinetobacter sp. NIPH 2023]MCH7356579.1 DUF1365 domain-containing protein [Acinetobacter sp. NIPH 1958]MCH7358270.1 DUF1365 domain-containing protein [Acinetobacter sp. NIPH 2024]